MAAKKMRKPSDRDWKTAEEKWLEKRVWTPKQEVGGYVDRSVYVDRIGRPKIQTRSFRFHSPPGVTAPAKKVNKKGKSKRV